VKKFEKVLNEFEFKSLFLIVFEKEKKKKENLTSLPFSPQRPTGPTSPPAAARLPAFLFLFLFPCTADRVAPPVRPPFSFLQRPFPSSVQDRRAAGIPALHRASPAPLPSLTPNERH
jgi:hypothetical protein